jgi:hypothetical protein
VSVNLLVDGILAGEGVVGRGSGWTTYGVNTE